MITVLVEPGTLHPGVTIPLHSGELHHLRVRRVEDHDSVRALDGMGGWGEGRLVPVHRELQFAVERVGRVPRPPRLALAVGAGDRERFGWLAEKSAELGVTDLIPLDTPRVRSVASRIRGGQVESLGRRAREALKQSGNLWAPVVHPLTGLDTALSMDGGQLLLATPRGGSIERGTVFGAVTVFIGPEGGFTEDEGSACLERGAIPVSLGPYLLRFETAALAAAASIVLHRESPHE